MIASVVNSFVMTVVLFKNNTNIRPEIKSKLVQNNKLVNVMG